MKVTRPYDPWQKVKTFHDLPADEVISALQKSLRRGDKEVALLIAYEMFLTSAEMEEFLWARLCVIAVEDVGLGTPDLAVLIETLYQQHKRYNRPDGDRFLFAAHAIRSIADSPKERGADDMTNYARLELVVRDNPPTVPDYAIDMHTKRGWEMGRGYEHFMREASKVEPLLEDRDTSFRDKIMAAIEAGELE